MLKARTKILVKTTTGPISLDFEFPKGSDIERVIAQLVQTTLCCNGADTLKQLIDDEFESHEKRKAAKLAAQDSAS